MGSYLVLLCILDLPLGNYSMALSLLQMLWASKNASRNMREWAKSHSWYYCANLQNSIFPQNNLEYNGYKCVQEQNAICLCSGVSHHHQLTWASLQFLKKGSHYPYVCIPMSSENLQSYLKTFNFKIPKL